jgi:LPXTG-motif cell wall-anchored protein
MSWNSSRYSANIGYGEYAYGKIEPILGTYSQKLYWEFTSQNTNVDITLRGLDHTNYVKLVNSQPYSFILLAQNGTQDRGIHTISSFSPLKIQYVVFLNLDNAHETTNLSYDFKLDDGLEGDTSVSWHNIDGNDHSSTYSSTIQITGLITNLRACDTDWYRVSMQAGAQLTVSLDYSIPISGEKPNLDIYLYNLNADQIDNETLSVPAVVSGNQSATGLMFIKILKVSGPDWDYTLTLTIGASNSTSSTSSSSSSNTGTQPLNNKTVLIIVLSIGGVILLGIGLIFWKKKKNSNFFGGVATS